MKIRVNKRKWNFVMFNIGCIVLLCLCLIGFFLISHTLLSVRAAERWRGSSDSRFSQIACFLPEDDTKTEGDIFQFRQILDQALTDASLKAPEGASLYQDAYSSSGTLTISGDHGTAKANAIGVGGNFFLFHPLQLRSGSYISEKDLMDDRVVLDEVLAWQLFGGYDVAGLTVTIDGFPFYVAGVVKREDDFATEKAYLDGAGFFLSYSAFERLTERGITCYELLLPDPVSGFAVGIVKERFSVGKGEILENSRRYDLKNLLSVAGNYGVRSMRNNGVIYPYWENAVRLTEDYLALLVVGIMFFALCPAITVLILIIYWVRRAQRTVRRKIPEGLNAARERRREKNYAKVGK